VDGSPSRRVPSSVGGPAMMTAAVAVPADHRDDWPCDRPCPRCDQGSVRTVPLSRGLVALVDDDDLAAVASSRWWADQISGIWYARRKTRRSDGGWTSQSMHTFLTGWPRVDHRDGDGLNNRRNNLREATSRQNNCNQKGRVGSSPFKGVSWDSRRKSWRAQIAAAQRHLHLGYFAEEHAAALAYDVAARKQFGEFAALNFSRFGERSALRNGVVRP
jgi:hypothetical protein